MLHMHWIVLLILYNKYIHEIIHTISKMHLNALSVPKFCVAVSNLLTYHWFQSYFRMMKVFFVDLVFKDFVREMWTTHSSAYHRLGQS